MLVLAVCEAHDDIKNPIARIKIKYFFIIIFLKFDDKELIRSYHIINNKSNIPQITNRLPKQPHYAKCKSSIKNYNFILFITGSRCEQSLFDKLNIESNSALVLIYLGM